MNCIPVPQKTTRQWLVLLKWKAYIDLEDMTGSQRMLPNGWDDLQKRDIFKDEDMSLPLCQEGSQGHFVWCIVHQEFPQDLH